MCRFSSSNDANYRKVGGEIGSIYKSITSKGNQESKYQKTKWMKERNGVLPLLLKSLLRLKTLGVYNNIDYARSLTTHY